MNRNNDNSNKDDDNDETDLKIKSKLINLNNLNFVVSGIIILIILILLLSIFILFYNKCNNKKIKHQLKIHADQIKALQNRHMKQIATIDKTIDDLPKIQMLVKMATNNREITNGIQNKLNHLDTMESKQNKQNINLTRSMGVLTEIIQEHKTNTDLMLKDLKMKYDLNANMMNNMNMSMMASSPQFQHILNQQPQSYLHNNNNQNVLNEKVNNSGDMIQIHTFNNKNKNNIKNNIKEIEENIDSDNSVMIKENVVPKDCPLPDDAFKFLKDVKKNNIDLQDSLSLK